MTGLWVWKILGSNPFSIVSGVEVNRHGRMGLVLVLEVNNMYRQHSLLWNVSHNDHHNNVKRNRALHVKLFQTKKRGAMRETVHSSEARLTKI